MLVVIVAVVTSVISAWSAYNSNAKLMEACKQRDMQTVVTVLQNSLQNKTNRAAAFATMISTIPMIQRSLRNKDPKTLESELTPPFQALKDQFSVEDGQFFLPPAFEFQR